MSLSIHLKVNFMILENQSELVCQAVIEAFIDDEMAPHNISLREARLVADKLDKLMKKHGFNIYKTIEKRKNDKRNRLQLQLE